MSRSIETITVILMVLSCVLNILNITVIWKTAIFFKGSTFSNVALLCLKKVSSGEKKQKNKRWDR